MRHNIVGIVGRKRHGKDSVADVLVRDHGFQKRAMAHWLKRACGDIFQLSFAQLHGDDKENVDPRWGVSARDILQKVGTDLLRDQLREVLPDLQLGPEQSLWCYCFRLWVQSQHTGQNIVVPDVRFPDEARMLKSLGAHLVRVTRPSLGNVPVDAHASETQIDHIEVDAEIINDGSLEDLEQKANSFVNDNVFSTSLALHTLIETTTTALKRAAPNTSHVAAPSLKKAKPRPLPIQT